MERSVSFTSRSSSLVAMRSSARWISRSRRRYSSRSTECSTCLSSWACVRARICDRADARIEIDHRNDARADQSGKQADQRRPEGTAEMEALIARAGITDDAIRGRSVRPHRGGAAEAGCRRCCSHKGSELPERCVWTLLLMSCGQ
jgi:hypothetical protein